MATLLRIAAVVICSIVSLGFLTFAAGESERASKQQISAVSTGAAERAREGESGVVEEAINDANDFFLAPFDGVTSSRNVWVQQLVPTALALLLYGLGLLLVANYLPKPKRSQTGWRAA
jgi:hypothetical protein